MPHENTLYEPIYTYNLFPQSEKKPQISLHTNTKKSLGKEIKLDSGVNTCIHIIVSSLIYFVVVLYEM